jgi:hypothetical protein
MKLGKEQKLEQLEKVLHSRTLQNSESLKAFLRFVVEKTVDNEDVLLKEYTIATEVFGRNSEYDPRIDSVVRVQAGRLRTKLHEYYTTEGKGDQIVIDLPKGHYHPVFNCPNLEASPETASSATHAAAAASSTEGADSNGHASTKAADGQPQVESLAPRGKSRTVVLLLCGLVILLGVAVLALYFSNRELRRQATGSFDASLNTEEFKAVWSPFLNDPEAPLLVLSNPPLFRFLNEADPGSLAGRAVPLTAEQIRSLLEAPEFKGQWTGGNTPRLVPSLGMYTGMGEAIGVYRLTDLLRASNKTILLRQSRHVSAADLKYRNVILLGSIYVNEWSRRLPSVENFVHTFKATIENRDPLPGEAQEYKPQFNEQTGQLAIDYALITVKPNVSGEHAVMTLAGIFSEGTEAAAEFVTTRNHMTVLGQRLRQLGGQNATPPRYYQALLKVEVENGTPTTITLLSLRALPEAGK